MAKRGEKMNLYKISQSENEGYDTFDSAIVAAPDEKAARRMPPAPKGDHRCDGGHWTAPPHVKVEWIGVAREGTPPGPILGSFNKG
jgi:hypothetical protein